MKTILASSAPGAVRFSDFADSPSTEGSGRRLARRRATRPNANRGVRDRLGGTVCYRQGEGIASGMDDFSQLGDQATLVDYGDCPPAALAKTPPLPPGFIPTFPQSVIPPRPPRSWEEKFKSRLRTARSMASRKRVPFCLSVEDLKAQWEQQEGLCYLTRQPMTKGVLYAQQFRDLCRDVVNASVIG
jgi:hypothetical protein